MVKDNLHVPVLRDPSYDLIVDIPGGLQLDVKGKNQLGRDITNGFILNIPIVVMWFYLPLVIL